MSFKKILCLSIVFLLSCSNENREVSTPINVEAAGQGNCLADISETLDAYWKSRLSATQVSDFWLCLGNSIHEFESLTIGPDNPDVYSPKAIRKFIETNFVKRPFLSDALMHVGMRIKKVILGGSNESISRSDLLHLQSLIEELRVMTIDLLPHIRIISGEDIGSDEEIAQAEESLGRSFDRLGRWMANVGEPLKFSDLKDFLNELNDNTENFNTDKYVSFIKATKGILLNGAEDQVSGGEWAILFHFAGRASSAYLNIAQGLKLDLHHMLTGPKIPNSLKALSDILNEALSFHSDRSIAMGDFRKLFQSVEDLGWLGSDIKADGVFGIWNWIVARLLSSSAASVSVLDAAPLDALSEKANAWLELLKDDTSDAGFQVILNSSMPMEWDSQGRLIFPEAGVANWTPENKKNILYAYFLMNWIKSSFIGETRTSLEQSEFDFAVAEVLPLFHGLGWLLTTEATISVRLLREADLFTLASNGNGDLDLSEAVRYLSFVLSATRISQIWMSEGDRLCSSHEAKCMRRIATDKNADILTSLPRLRALIETDPNFNFSKYFIQAEETILGKAVTTSFEVSDLLQPLMLVQYAETFLRLYDTDLSQTISLPESQVSFEVYRYTLARLLGVSPDLDREIMWEFFSFMMKYGGPPTAILGGDILYNHWKWYPEKRSYDAGRPILMGILNVLSKQ